MWAGEKERPEAVFNSFDYDFEQLTKTFNDLGFDSEFYLEIPTTMAVVDRLALADAPQTVVVANHQTNGIGREGRVWHDKKDSSILVSTLLRLADPSHIKELADLAALETCIALREVTGEEIKIKYPNDIVFDDAKLGGILVKNIFDTEGKYRGTNVGIGVNVHYSDEELSDYPTDYGATSLDMVADREISRQDGLSAMLGRLRYSTFNAAIIHNNPHEADIANTLWRSVSSVLGRDVVVLGQAETKGRVIDTRIGEGILVLGEDGEKTWHNLFDTDMKVRIVK